MSKQRPSELYTDVYTSGIPLLGNKVLAIVEGWPYLRGVGTKVSVVVIGRGGH